jgi:hypothetical protein
LAKGRICHSTRAARRPAIWQITLIAAGAAILFSFAAVLVAGARAARRHQTAPQRMTARHSARRVVHHLQLRRHPLPGRELQQLLQRVGGPVFAAGRRAGQSQAGLNRHSVVPKLRVGQVAVR